MPDSFIKSRPLDVWRWTEYPELNKCLGDIAAEIEHTENRQRARSRDDAKRFRDALRTIVLDLYVAWKTDPGLQVAVPLSAGAFSRDSTRYRAFFLTYRQFTAAFDGLKKLGYLTVDKRGNIDRSTGKGYLTRARATAKLIEKLTGNPELSLVLVQRNPDEETIVLKDKDLNRIDYMDTSETRAMRDSLERINKMLNANFIDLRLTDAEFAELEKLLVKKGQENPNDPDPNRNGLAVSAKTLRRVFNNGSFEEGGRFYGGFWMSVPRDYRKRVVINDKDTVELDYSAI